ncbi:hypothetical protein GWI33_022374 [Rhynchophorus ferrugineus]|uniref:Uncharacterized protein n=1 Tax=Rhynchophorus ferrugineus TaxID=354439 RepID=A0A834INJ4_RHYFE|nr:hypothetical protein GWI33_022374 [Rhynchophorus ferrugineus]
MTIIKGGLILSFICLIHRGTAQTTLGHLFSEEVSNISFPKNFKWGYASAAYQVEGAWNLDGKGPSVWDYDARNNPDWFINGQNGDVGPDGYHNVDVDIELLLRQKVNTYRLSIAWTRILPNGLLSGGINQKGIDFYKNIITKLRANNIEPVVTMMHWDQPRALEDNGGFLNESIIPAFLDYATLLWETYGDDVQWWTTFNEPKQICGGGYDWGWSSPQNLLPGIGSYICGHNLLRAHAKAYKIYNERFRETQKGKISVNLDLTWQEPATNSPEDEEAAERGRLFWLGWFAHPMVFGDYPEIMKQRIGDRSRRLNLTTSRLPEFTEEEKEELKDSIDFFAIQMYTTNLVTAQEDAPVNETSFDNDLSINSYQPDDWPTTLSSWFRVVPWGARRLLNWIRDTYGDEKGIFITENGYPDDQTILEDMDTRGRCHKLYLSNINDAIYKDKINVIGYLAWSLIDDVEWYGGWVVTFGQYNVDFTSENKTRTPKQSTEYYRKVVTTGCLVDDCVEPL